jgi:3-phytase
MAKRILAGSLSGFLCVIALGPVGATAQPTVSSSLTLRAPGIADQDDVTFWLHPTDLSLSTIIASDKSANKLFVYDLTGTALQVIAAQTPGNIDARYGFRLGAESVDVVAFNERATNKIRVYRVDPGSRQLVQIDDGTIDSGPNYGFTMYKSPVNGKFYAFTGPSSSTRVKQFELVDPDNDGRVSAVLVRQLQQLGGTVEGMVADDEEGTLYLAEEPGGIWKFDAESDGATSGTKIASVGQNGLTADVEGVAMYYGPNGQGYIVASSQGDSTFKIYERQSPHAFVGTFAISGVANTDGIDVINSPLGSRFPYGMFASHNGHTSPYAVDVVRWEDIAETLGLRIDTEYWDARRGGYGQAVEDPEASPGALGQPDHPVSRYQQGRPARSS